MAEGDELEKRAIEELLRETDRARVRAETMGPAGWLKCPLRGTNKCFLLNTLRSTGLQRRTGEPRTGHTAPRGRLTSKSPATRGRLTSKSPDRSRDRSRTPPRDHRSSGAHTDHHHRDRRSNKNEKHDRDNEGSYRHRDSRDRRRGEVELNPDKNRDRLLE